MPINEIKRIVFVALDEDAGKRVDLYCSEKLPITRSALKDIFSSGNVALNSKRAKPGNKLKSGDSIGVTLPRAREVKLVAEELPLEIIYQDAEIAVINKPAGLAVHPGAGRSTGTLVNALLFHIKKLSGAGDADRPGIVHRLDKDTSGLLVVAKTDHSYFNLVEQFKEHSASRKYAALVWGDLEGDVGSIDAPIGRDIRHRQRISTNSTKTRPAITHFKVMKRYGALTLLELKLETGRTHQIRVHLSSIKHPVACDPVYGKRKIPSTLPKQVQDALKAASRQLLHARELSITHPKTKKRRRWTTKLPPDFQSVIDALDESMPSSDRP